MPDAEHPVGIVVEGQSEYYAIPKLLSRHGIRHTVPAVFGGQNVELMPAALVRRAVPAVRSQLGKKIRKLVIVVDREGREQCAPEFAAAVRRAMLRELRKHETVPDRMIAVVCADRMLENWLIADVVEIRRHALAKKGGAPGQKLNVDGIDGLGELRRVVPQYRKGSLAGELAARVRIGDQQVLKRSRSLRKLAKEVGMLVHASRRETKS